MFERTGGEDDVVCTVHKGVLQLTDNIKRPSINTHRLAVGSVEARTTATVAGWPGRRSVGPIP